MEEGHSDKRPRKSSPESDQDLSSPNNSEHIISASGQALTHRWLAVIAAIILVLLIKKRPASMLSDNSNIMPNDPHRRDHSVNGPW